MEQTKNKEWGAVLFAGASALVILSLLAGGMFAFVSGWMEWRNTGGASDSLFPASLLSAAFLAIALVVGRSGLLALNRIQNKPGDPARVPLLSFPVILALFGGWIISIVLATILHQKPAAQWFSIPFYLLAVGLPVYALIRLGAGGLGLGSRLRAWGTLSAGMTAAPFLSGLAEGFAALIALVVIGVFVGLNPQRLASLQSLMEQLKAISTQEQALSILTPILTHPLTLVAGLFFLSLVTPLVEEIAKSLPVWAAWRKLESPSQGFALGALSGAGFGLAEGLLVSASPGKTWGVTLSVRAASTAMHIVTSGLVGWGIGKAAQQKRVLPALGGTLLGVTIHALWNASIVIMVYASALTLLSAASPNIFAAFIILVALGFLGLLILAAPIVLWAINHQLRKSLPAPAAPEIIIEPGQSKNMVI